MRKAKNTFEIAVGFDDPQAACSEEITIGLLNYQARYPQIFELCLERFQISPAYMRSHFAKLISADLRAKTRHLELFFGGEQFWDHPEGTYLVFHILAELLRGKSLKMIIESRWNWHESEWLAILEDFRCKSVCVEIPMPNILEHHSQEDKKRIREDRRYYQRFIQKAERAITSDSSPPDLLEQCSSFAMRPSEIFPDKRFQDAYSTRDKVSDARWLNTTYDDAYRAMFSDNETDLKETLEGSRNTLDRHWQHRATCSMSAEECNEEHYKSGWGGR